MFKKYGLDKIKDSLTENFDYKKSSPEWEHVETKTVLDSDGFTTEYTWYTDGTKHIFMFGDSDIYTPDEDYADWCTESEEEAREWFNNYKGFEEEEDFWEQLRDVSDDFEDTYSGNKNFMNDGFDRAYNITDELED